MRAFTVFVVTYILGMIILVSAFHAFMERSGMIVIALAILVMGCVFGALAGWWRWTLSHPVAFSCAGFCAGMTMLLPFVLVTYGFALVAFPLVLLWPGMAFLGLKLTQKLRARNASRQ